MYWRIDINCYTLYWRSKLELNCLKVFRKEEKTYMLALNNVIMYNNVPSHSLGQIILTDNGDSQCLLWRLQQKGQGPQYWFQFHAVKLWLFINKQLCLCSLSPTFQHFLWIFFKWMYMYKIFIFPKMLDLSFLVNFRNIHNRERELLFSDKNFNI